MTPIPDWLLPYLERSEILRTIVAMFTAGKSDAEIANRFGIPEQAAMLARKKWRLYREEECPHCGTFPYDGVECTNNLCISNW